MRNFGSVMSLKVDTFVQSTQRTKGGEVEVQGRQKGCGSISQQRVPTQQRYFAAHELTESTRKLTDHSIVRRLARRTSTVDSDMLEYR
jgi:hypothetical protein